MLRKAYSSESFPGALFGRADHFGRSPGSLDFFQRRLRKDVRGDLNLTGQLPGAQDLDAVAQFLDHTQFDKAVGVEALAIQLLQPPQIHDSVLFLENVGEAALGQAPVYWHLAAFEPALLAETGTGVLAFAAARRGLAAPRSHAAPDALPGFFLTGRR